MAGRPQLLPLLDPSASMPVAGEEHDTPVEDDFDIWRDSAARYLGYANELGESFRPIAARLVKPSYGVSFAYVFVDTYDKRQRALKDEKVPETKRAALANAATVDTLASVIVPGYTIKAAVAFMTKQITQPSGLIHGRFQRMGSPRWMQLWLPTAFGLSLIPFIVTPIDKGVHYLLDATLRPALDKAVGDEVVET